MQAIAAWKASKHYLTCISAWTDLWISPPIALQQALADDDNVVNDQTFDMNLDGDGDDWITASEDDGECDKIINNLCCECQDPGIQSVVYFSVMQN